MKKQAGQSRLDTVLKMLLIAFVSLLAFSSGVYFGKQMSDSDYQLKALESDFNESRKTASVEKKDLDVKEEDALVDEEVAALSDKYMNTERDNLAEIATKEDGNDAEDTHAAADTHAQAAPAHETHAPAKAVAAAPAHGAAPAHTTAPAAPAHGAVAAHPVAPAAKTATTTATRPDLTAVQKAAQRIANNQAPTEAPKVQENRVPSSLPRTVGAPTDIEFTVQVASFPTVEDAKSYADGLVKKGYPAYPVEANVKGKTWYRVSIGSFKTQKDATNYRAQILKETDLRSAIVQRIQR